MSTHHDAETTRPGTPATTTDADPSPPRRPLDQPAAGTTSRGDRRRRKRLGAWLVAAGATLWLGVLLFIVGPSPGPGVSPTDQSGRPWLGSPTPERTATGAAGAEGAPGPRRSAPALIPADDRAPAPSFSLPDIDGRVATLDDYTGRVLLLNFWATWCQPCRAEMPWFVEFQDTLGDDFAVLGVSLDEPGWDIVHPFLVRYPVNYRIALADTTQRQSPFGPMNILPTTWLIDRRGRIANRHVGLVDRVALESEIRQLLAE